MSNGVETKEWMVVLSQEKNGETRSSPCTILVCGWARGALLGLQMLLLFPVPLLVQKRDIQNEEKNVVDLRELLFLRLVLVLPVLRVILILDLVLVLVPVVLVVVVVQQMRLSDNEFLVCPMLNG